MARYKVDITGINTSEIKVLTNEEMTHLFVRLKNGDIDAKTELITNLESEYEANIIMVDTMYTLTDEETNNNETYLTIMRDFIDNIRNTAIFVALLICINV